MSNTEQPTEMNRRKFLVAMGAAAAAPAVLAACGSDKPAAATTTTGKPAEATTTAAPAGETTTSGAATAVKEIPKDLIDAAKKEGKINLIALPDGWANYKGVLAGYKSTYGINFKVDNPDGSSADEVKAVETLKGQPTQPDSIDVGPAFAYDGAKSGLFEPYKVSSFDEIPENMRDADGNWVAAYYGIISIACNEKIAGAAPKSFAELADKKYKGMLALNGDPRKSGSGLAGVIAAALANGGSLDDITPGIDYFAKLKNDGILKPVDLTEALYINGEAAIGIDWSYNYVSTVDKMKENGIILVTNVPTDGVYGGFYAQGVVKGSPNQNAAKLWLEWLVSDGGATEYIKGGAFPARYVAMDKAGKIPAELKAKLPSADIVAKVKFPTPDQVKKAKEIIAAQWGPKVSGN